MPREPLIQACLNGRRTHDEHPAAPVTPEELAREGRAAVQAGAGSLHIHPRGPDGRETLDAGPRADALAALRAACPGVEISVTTGHWIEGDSGRRLAKVAGWTTLPDLASVNVKEPGAFELWHLLQGLGVRIEAGIANVADTRALLASGVAQTAARVLIEVEGDAAAALREAEAIDGLLDRAELALPRLHHGYHAATWAVVERALRLGHDVRVGLEDVMVMPDGRKAGGNGELVAACAGLWERVLGSRP